MLIHQYSAVCANILSTLSGQKWDYFSARGLADSLASSTGPEYTNKEEVNSLKSTADMRLEDF